MRKPHKLKVRRYVARLIELNNFLSLFPGAKLTEKIKVAKINEILLNSMPNSWSKQAHVQGFYCKSVNFKKDINIFECMDISESIYEGLVEPYYKNL